MKQKAKTGKKKEEYVMVCPKCKSPDVSIDSSNPVQPAMGLPAMHCCNRCGHCGIIFPEVPVSELEEFENEAEAEGLTEASQDLSPKVDIRYGIFHLRVFLRITAAGMMAVGLFLIFKGDYAAAAYLLMGLALFIFTFLGQGKK